MSRKPKTPIIIPFAVAQRAATRFTEDPVTGCWVSDYKPGNEGYPLMGFRNHDGRKTTATVGRAAIVYHNEEQIPEGLTVQHNCRNRACVNPHPDHMELWTEKDNSSDPDKLGRQAPVPTGRTCRRGHEILAFQSGRERCRECVQASVDRRVARRATVIVEGPGQAALDRVRAQAFTIAAQFTTRTHTN